LSDSLNKYNSYLSILDIFNLIGMTIFTAIKTAVKIVLAGLFFSSRYRFFTIGKPTDRFAITQTWHLFTGFLVDFMISLFVDF